MHLCIIYYIVIHRVSIYTHLYCISGVKLGMKLSDLLEKFKKSHSVLMGDSLNNITHYTKQKYFIYYRHVT